MKIKAATHKWLIVRFALAAVSVVLFLYGEIVRELQWRRFNKELKERGPSLSTRALQR